jgi:hypothetical protein
MDLKKGWNFASMLNFQIETAIFKDGVLYNFNDSKIKIENICNIPKLQICHKNTSIFRP